MAAARVLALAVLAALLLPGCVSGSRGGTEGTAGAGPEGDASLLDPVLPSPFGKVGFADDPAIFLLGWAGFVGGGAAGTAVVVCAEAAGGTGSSTGEGEVAFIYLCGLTGSLALTLPIYGIECLFGWVAGTGGEDPPGSPPPPPGSDVR